MDVLYIKSNKNTKGMCVLKWKIELNYKGVEANDNRVEKKLEIYGANKGRKDGIALKEYVTIFLICLLSTVQQKSITVHFLLSSTGAILRVTF